MSKGKKSKRAARNGDRSKGKHSDNGTATIEPPEPSTLEGDGRVVAVVASEPEPVVVDEEESATERSAPAPEPEVSSNGTETKGDETEEAIVPPAEEAGQTDWPVDLSKVDVVRERQATFIVFIDQEQRLRWLAATSPSDLSEESQSVIARTRLVAATPTAYFKEGQQKAWMRMLGESLALALSGDVDNSKRTLSMAEKFVASRARETARIWYVKASLLAFVALASVGVLLSLIPEQTPKTWMDGSIGIAVLFGAIGSQFSVLLRLSSLQVDPGAGRDAHYLEAVVRILMGSFAAVIAVVAVQAEIVFGFMTGVSNLWLIPTVALLAGASERFVPGILHKVEQTS